MYELYRTYPWLPDAIIYLTACFVAGSCALVGTFLVLRRMSMVSDAISHTILPGIAVAFMLTRSLDPFIMIIGAVFAGLATVWLIETLYKSRRVYEDAAIAIVFSGLFALGVILIHQYPHTHLDLDCVVFGAIEHVPMDFTGSSDDPHTLLFGLVPLEPRAPWILGAVFIVNLFLVVCFYKELKINTFDAPLGQSLGLSPTLVHYVLMTAVSITTVAAFEAVGAILVIAFLIVPPATAYLLTGRLWLMLLLAIGFGLLSVQSGFTMARTLKTSYAGSMATMTGIWFLLVWIAAPRYGLVATWQRRAGLRNRFAADLLLLHLQKTGPAEEVDILARQRFKWRPAFGRRILRDLQDRGLVALSDGSIRLTRSGVDAVAELGQRYQER